MAIQAQLYPENLGLPLMGGIGGVSQDWLFMANNQNNNIISNNNNTNNNNSNLYVNGCGFNEFTSNNLQQQKQQQQFQFQQQQQQQEVLLQLQQQYLLQFQNQQQQQQQQRNSCGNNNDGFVFLSSSKNCTTTTTATTASTTTTGSDYQMPMNFSPSFADQLEKQRQEIDRFITLQNERLKLALQEQRKQQLANMMRKLEAKAMQLLRQKDDEIARAGKRTMELEEIIRKMEVENQEWQRLAAENEAMVVSLSNTIEQIKEQGCCIASSSTSSNEVGDAESCCNVNNIDESYSSKKRGREEIITEVEEKKRVKAEVLCKVCKSGNSCVLLLPCRHLCCCKDCEAFVDVCPVCKSVKMESIEALFS